jgi:hypothetical protein
MRSRRNTLLLGLLFVVSLPAVTARLYSSDEVEYFSYLRSLWFDHDVSFDNEYRYFSEHGVAQTPDFHQTFLELETATGRRINYGTIGCAILWAPFYGVADAMVRASQSRGGTVDANGYSKPYVAAVAYGSAFYGFMTIILSIAAARQVVGKYAFSSGVAVWLGTPLLFYMYVAPPFSHACSAFAVALFVTVWLKTRQTWSVGGVIALGLTGALMAMVREQDLFIAVGPVADLCLSLITGKRVRPEPASKDKRREAARPSERKWDSARSNKSGRVPRIIVVALAGGIAFIIGYLPQLLAYQALNGAPRPSPLVTRKMFWHAPHALQVLADPQHGWFFWTPLVVLALIGLIWLAARAGAAAGHETDRARDVRQIAVSMLLMIVGQIYVSGAVESWTVAGAFGQRRFVAVTIFLVVGLAGLQSRIVSRGAKVVANMAIVVAVWWNLALTAEFGTGMMDRQRLELARNAYDAFVTLPRIAPDLVYRYFTNRSSFYKPPATTR